MAQTGKKIIITVLCVILMCGAVLSAVLYAEGYYDFTFIDRKQDMNETEPPPEDIAGTDAPETEDGGHIYEETQPEPVEIPSADGYLSDGYKVTNGIYNSEKHVIARLPLNLPKSYASSKILKPATSVSYNEDGIERLFEYSQKESDLYSAELYMGYIIASDGGVSTIYSPNGEKLVSVQTDTMTELVYKRDKNGLPVFRINGADYVIKNGSFERTTAVDTGLYYNFTPALGKAQTLYSAKQDGNFVYKNANGEDVFSLSCDKAYNFSDGYGIVHKNGELFCYNENGKQMFSALPVGNTDIYGTGSLYFDSGYVMVRVIAYRKNVLTEDYDVLVNYKGKELAPPFGTKLISYSNQRMLLEKDGKYGFYALKNDWTAEIKYTYATPFCEGLAVVGDKDGKKGVIDLEGRVVVPFEYDRITECSDGVFLAYTVNDGWCAFAKLDNQ